MNTNKLGGLYRITRNINLGYGPLTNMGVGEHNLLLYVPTFPKAVPKILKPYLKDIGNGQLGITFGGYRNSSRRGVTTPILIGGINYPTDKKILRDDLSNTDKSFNVTYKKIATSYPSNKAVKLLTSIHNFNKNTKGKHSVIYRAVPIKNLVGIRTLGHNSNSFINTLAQIVGLNNTFDNVKGNDPGTQKLLEPYLFNSIRNPNDDISFNKVKAIIKANKDRRKLRNTLISAVVAGSSVGIMRYLASKRKGKSNTDALKKSSLYGLGAGVGAALLAHIFQQTPLTETPLYTKLLSKRDDKGLIKRKDLYSAVDSEKKRSDYKDAIKSGAGSALLGAVTVAGAGGPALIGSTALGSGLWGGTFGAYTDKKYSENLDKLKNIVKYTDEFKDLTK